MSEKIIPACFDYDVSEKYGFIYEDNLEVLPEYFKPWQVLADNLSELLTSKQLQDEVNKLEDLDVSKLNTDQEKRLAYVVLTFLMQGYLWQNGLEDFKKVSRYSHSGGSAFSIQVLPRQIAVPVMTLAKEMDIPPMFIYLSNTLGNVVFSASGQPRVLFSIPPVEAFDWLIIVTAKVEVASADGIKAILRAMGAVQENDCECLRKELQAMSRSLINMTEEFKEMHANLSTDGFQKMALFLNGYGLPSGPNVDGLVFEGVSSDPVKGLLPANASNTSSLQCFLVALGVQHTEDDNAAFKTYKDSMPKKHRQFLEALAKGPSISAFIKASGDQGLVELYENCIQRISDFRSYHIKIFAKYVVGPLSKDENAPKELLSHLMQKLKTLRDNTKGVSMIPE